MAAWLENAPFQLKEVEQVNRRPNQFVSTDCFLELQKYWLIYYFRNSGIGTDIKQLKDVF
ncbi:hypothetical protein VP01_922g1 [Puccinia sorghi]|uniref:Uncharacterized protein n=1 Tax=Puccinia sorghi TaxID=27349 RepID=A0A0L6U792_9BASI|nr:hypothetical protein VP01_922g1 [Puccinia sorghi]